MSVTKILKRFSSRQSLKGPPETNHSSPEVSPNSNSKPPATEKFSSSDDRIKPLGKGISGTVELYQSKTKSLYVVKTYYPKESYETKREYRKRVLKEYNTLSHLKHINIIELYDYKVSLSGSVIKVFMEYGVTDLFQLVKMISLPINTIFCFWKQLCFGVNFLHSHGMCHRDLKLENLVISATGIVKIIDFDTIFNVEQHNGTTPVNVLTGETLASGLVGSESYAAPETARQIRYDGKIADIWSIGIIFYYLINHKLPWNNATKRDLKYVSFLEDQNSVTDSEGQLLSPVYNKYDTEIGINGVLRHLPSQTHKLMKNIFIANPNLRCNMEFIMTDTWFCELKYCSEAGTCGVGHSIMLSRFCLSI